MKTLLPPLFIVIVIGVISLACVWTQEAWLAPSIAAAAFTQMFNPTQPSGKPYGIALGQVIGAAAGFAGVYAVHATSVAKLIGDHDLTYQRIAAVIIAVAIAAFVQTAVKAKSPAGGTTAAVVAIGVETANWAGAMRLAVGIAFVTILGEGFRQLLLRMEASSAVRSGDPATASTLRSAELP